MQEVISALAVPPGNSLTDEPGRWPWESPAQFPDPDDAIDYIVENIGDGPAREDMLKMMLAGITVEELVTQISFKGFAAGAFTPDVAELIKPAIGIFLVSMAQEEGFEPTMFVDTDKQEGEMSDETFFEILKERNPEMFEGMVEELNRMQRQGVEKQREEVTQVATEAQDAQEKQKRIQNSFLAAREE
tara:strand:+ start:311 stop:874 length:564 start_codon:yes stop_codon:yes gene_type:complete